MSRPLLASLLLVVACANKEAPSSAPADAADANRTELPVAGDADDGADDDAGAEADAEVACSPSETVLVKESRAPLSGSMPAIGVTVYDNGHWALAGPSPKSGCLDEAQLGEVKAALEGAQIVAKPLEPGMARCMAMPIHTVTVEAKGETASWKAPCGPSNPDPTLGALMQKLSELTSQ